MCIKMLELLSSGRIYKVSLLASLLETKERNIIEYKKELEECGYYITSIPGRYGGLKLESSCVIPSIKFNEEEIESLKESYSYLISKNDFIKKKEYQNAFSKIFASINEVGDNDDIYIIDKYPLLMSQKDLESRYKFLEEAIKTKTSVIINYNGRNNIETEFKLDPYELFMYNNSWFVIGWSQTRGDITYFKLNRIINYQEMNKKFEVTTLYNRNDYINEYGFKAFEDWYHIEFIVTGIYSSMIKDRVYGKNQEIISIDSSKTKVIVDMQDKEAILKFVLGYGEYITILEPNWLKDSVKKACKKVISKY